MMPSEIKQRIKDKNWTQARLARRFGVSTAAMTNFIQGKIVSARLTRRLARELELPEDDIRSLSKPSGEMV